MAYIYGLIIDSISVPAKDSIQVKTRALQHERAMVHEYAKMKPGRFTKQLQAIDQVDARSQWLPQAQVLDAPGRDRGRRHDARR